MGSAPRAVLDKLGWNDGLHNFLVKTAKFQTYTSISQNLWDQEVAAILKLPVFDDEENDELEHDIHSFVDKTTHLMTAVLRRCVEMSML